MYYSTVLLQGYPTYPSTGRYIYYHLHHHNKDTHSSAVRAPARLAEVMGSNPIVYFFVVAYKNAKDCYHSLAFSLCKKFVVNVRYKYMLKKNAQYIRCVKFMYI